MAAYRTSLLELIWALREVAASDLEVVATLRHMIRSGRVHRVRLEESG